MCGRFLQTGDPDDYAAYLDARSIVTEPLPRSWNVAPTDVVYTGAVHDGERLLGTMQWGLIPRWSRDGRPGPINARTETAATRPTFRESFRSRNRKSWTPGIVQHELRVRFLR